MGTSGASAGSQRPPNEGGIRTVLDLVNADVAALRSSSRGARKSVLELRGTACLDVDDAPSANQQIMCSRSFGAPVTDCPAGRGREPVCLARGGEGPAAAVVGGAVQVFVTTSPFRKHDGGMSQRRDAAGRPASTPG